MDSRYSISSAQGECDDQVYEFADQADQIAAKSGIRILRDKELSMVALDGENVVGALYTSFGPHEDEEIYSFDVVVAKEHEGRGIGRRLAEIGISEFGQYQDIPEAKMKLDVVNPAMQRILSKLGLCVTGTAPGRVFMEKPNAMPPAPIPGVELPLSRDLAL